MQITPAFFSNPNIPRFSLKNVVFIVLAVVVFDFIIVTNFTGNLFITAFHGSSYDDLGTSLLKGESTVNPISIQKEILMRDGKSFMYFGPFPALLRIVANSIYPKLYGRWSRLSCLFAALLGQFGVAGLLLIFLSRNKHLDLAN